MMVLLCQNNMSVVEPKIFCEARDDSNEISALTSLGTIPIQGHVIPYLMVSKSSSARSRLLARDQDCQGGKGVYSQRNRPSQSGCYLHKMNCNKRSCGHKTK